MYKSDKSDTLQNMRDTERKPLSADTLQFQSDTTSSTSLPSLICKAVGCYIRRNVLFKYSVIRSAESKCNTVCKSVNRCIFIKGTKQWNTMCTYEHLKIVYYVHAECNSYNRGDGKRPASVPHSVSNLTNGVYLETGFFLY